jgi:hypothetical protein
VSDAGECGESRESDDDLPSAPEPADPRWAVLSELEIQ